MNEALTRRPASRTWSEKRLLFKPPSSGAVLPAAKWTGPRQPASSFKLLGTLPSVSRAVLLTPKPSALSSNAPITTCRLVGRQATRQILLTCLNSNGRDIRFPKNS